MVEYYENKLGITANFLIEERILSKSNYDALVMRNKVQLLRRGGNGRTALIEYSSIPDRFRSEIEKRIGDPRKVQKHQFFRSFLTTDKKALEFFSNYQLENGTLLKTEIAKEYYMNALFLKTCLFLAENTEAKRKALGAKRTGIWLSLTEIVNDLREGFGHSLPANSLRLKEKSQIFAAQGFSSLVHRNYGNKNSAKLNEMIERLLLSLSAMETNPFADKVHSLYLQFLAGSIIVVDETTGEAFDRFEFFKDEKPISISVATVWNVLRNPENESIINKKRLSRSDYTMTQMPYARRMAPQYSFSKITMDDRTLPRKTATNQWVNVYYAMDVMSGCYLAAVYTLDKPTVHLVFECFRELYRVTEAHNLHWALEVEVENHLMSEIKPTLNNLFTYVRFCNPQNSREKRAEHLIRAKKYGIEKNTQRGIERWYGRGAYKKNEDVKNKLFSEQIIQEDRETIAAFNNQLHPKQDLYPNMTRWQVLLANPNPDASRPQKFRIFKEIGYVTETSIRNKDSVTVQYADYWIDSSVLNRLKPNDYNVQAYYLPDAKGVISEVYLYQGDTFLCKADKIERYQEALAEQTNADKEIMLAHQKRQAHRRKEVADGLENKVVKIEIVKNDFKEIEETTKKEIHQTIENENTNFWDEDEFSYSIDYAKDNI